MRRSTLTLLSFVLLLAADVGAQPRSGAADIPRLANGKPNFSGVWQALTTANWNVLTHGASAGPPEGAPCYDALAMSEMDPEERARNNQHRLERHRPPSSTPAASSSSSSGCSGGSSAPSSATP